MDAWWETDPEIQARLTETSKLWCEEQKIKFQTWQTQYEDCRAKELKEKKERMVKEHAKQIEQGKLWDPFLRQHLEAQISIERWKLFIGIVLTVLIKYQWVLWIFLIIIHCLKVKHLTEEAQKIDQESWEKYYARLDGKE